MKRRTIKFVISVINIILFGVILRLSENYTSRLMESGTLPAKNCTHADGDPQCLRESDPAAGKRGRERYEMNISYLRHHVAEISIARNIQITRNGCCKSSRDRSTVVTKKRKKKKL